MSKLTVRQVLEETYKSVLNEIGPIKERSQVQRFIEDYIKNIDNPFVMSVYSRMLSTGKFIKNGHTMFEFTPEELQLIESIKPKLNNISNLVNEIKNAIK